MNVLGSRYFNYTNASIADGSYTTRFYCNDSAGNQNSSVTRVFTKDNAAPVINNVTAPTARNYTTSSINFSVSVNEDIGTCIVSLDGLNASNSTMSLNATGTGANYTNTSIADGSYTASFWCNDSAGNVNNTVTRVFSVDATAPTVGFNTTYVRAGYNYTSALNRQITIHNSSDTINTWWYNGTANLTYTETAYINLTNGTYTLIAYANDTHANLRTNISIIKIDSVAPTISVEVPEDGETYDDEDITFLLYTDETTSWCGYSLDDGANTTMDVYNTTLFNITEDNLDDGDYNVTFTCNDTTGNIDTAFVEFEIDAVSSGDDSGDDSGNPVTNFWTLTTNVNSSQFSSGYSTNMSSHSRSKIVIEGADHYVGVISVGSRTATINISSTPQQAVLDIGETKKFDVDSDNNYELSVTLLGISSSRASLLIQAASGIVNPVANCTDSCTSKGYNCGNWTLCNSSVNCGSCNSTQSCSANGKCETIEADDSNKPVMSLRTKILWIILALIIVVIIAIASRMYLRGRYYKKGW